MPEEVGVVAERGERAEAALAAAALPLLWGTETLGSRSPLEEELLLLLKDFIALVVY